MIESGMEPQKIADILLEQAERAREGLPATKEEEAEYFSDEIIIVRILVTAFSPGSGWPP